MTQTERDYYAFAELVRKLAIGLNRSAIAGKLDSVQEKASALLQLACERKRELRERMDADTGGEPYNLSELREEFGEEETDGE